MFNEDMDIKKKHILIAEDDPGVIVVLEDIFSGEYDITVVTEGKGLYRELVSNPQKYTLCIVDVSLEDGVRGDQVIVNAYLEGVSLPVVFVTGGTVHPYAQDENIISVTFKKPFKIPELYQTVTDIVSSKKYMHSVIE